MYRIGIVGATSLKGKELGDELEDSLLAASDFVLFDDEEASGQVTAVGDEAAVIQRLEPDSFARMDFVFFAGEQDEAAEHWQEARRAGASVIDLTYELEEQRGVLVRSPLLQALGGSTAPTGGMPNLETPAVVAAHPAAVMLALIASRLARAMHVESMAATLVEPASEHGRLAMDELHQQTVKLLSFQTLPREQYDAQVAFNVLPSLGETARIPLLLIEQRIVRHYQLIGDKTLPRLDLELIQAPVFHGYVASMMLQLAEAATVHQLESALAGEGIDVVTDASDPPSNLSAAGQEDIMVRVRSTGEPGGSATRFWLWLAVDNLKFGALNAIACASELRKLRPWGKVQ